MRSLKSAKLMPLLIPLILIFMLVISVMNVMEYNGNITADYNKHIKAAEKYLEKDILIDAVSEYRQALSIKPNDYDTAIKLAGLYKQMDNSSQMIWAYKAAITADSEKLEPYIFIADYYLDKNNNAEAYSILSQAKKKIASEEIDSRILKIKSEYHVSQVRYEEMLPYFGFPGSDTSYSVVKYQGKYGLISKGSNKLTIKCEYEDIGLYSDYVIPVKIDGSYYYMNSKKYKKRVPDEPMDYLGAYSDGYAPAKKGSTYGYLDKNMKEYHFEYDFAGGFLNGVAAVKKDGKWAVINSSFKNVTDFIFDDILLNEYNYCSCYKLFFAKRDGKYYLYNTNGECKSEGYDDARMFASTKEPAAVKSGDKWGFISKDGKIVIQPAYQNAYSFNVGYAPFCENGKWGCIDQEGHVLINPQFDEMHPFDNTGEAIVKDKGLLKILSVAVYK